MNDLISRQEIRKAMYHEAMEKDSDEQKWDGGCWIRYKMFERVLEALPSAQPDVPDTNVGDIISREAAIEAVGKIERTDNWKAAVSMVLYDLPSAQPERKKGEWVEKKVIHEVEASTAIDEWQSAKCSVCGKYHTTPYLYYFDDFNYCPNCGSYNGGDNNEVD